MPSHSRRQTFFAGFWKPPTLWREHGITNLKGNTPKSYNVGDIVNGHVLGSDNQWHPVTGGTATATATLEHSAAPAGALKSKPFYRRWWFIGATGLALIAIIARGDWGQGLVVQGERRQ